MAQCLHAGGANIKAKTTSGNSGMMWAALNGHTHVLEWLLTVGSEEGEVTESVGELKVSRAPDSIMRDANNIGLYVVYLYHVFS
mmetsp:Transcript_20383/g.26525  ORF Transcript_20383/g.26525 Transcript_20383/m.26525 type:complete len:84 (-) Transcript_20383:438-689(-)